MIAESEKPRYTNLSGLPYLAISKQNNVSNLDARNLPGPSLARLVLLIKQSWFFICEGMQSGGEFVFGKVID